MQSLLNELLNQLWKQHLYMKNMWNKRWKIKRLHIIQSRLSLAQDICTLQFQFFGADFASKGYPFENIFDFTTAGDWDCVAAVERLPALHYSVDFILFSFGIMGFIVELWNY